MSSAFSLVAFALSACVCENWAHDVLYHELQVQALTPHVAALLLVLLAIFLSPYFAFTRRLVLLKRQALLDYGALIGHHDRLVDRRWIRRQNVDADEILDAPELGPVADIHQLFAAVLAMRPVCR